MKKLRKPIQYDYLVHTLTDCDDVGYEATIPALDNAVVYGGNVRELEEGIRFAIDSERILRKKEGRAMPPPDANKHYSGKFVVRIDPAVHERLALQAKARGKSLNAYIKQKISAN